jgi:hypothetical protein
MRGRAIVALSFACNNECVFCGQEGLDLAVEPAEVQLDRIPARQRTVTFVGGEPTLEPRLVEHIAAAKQRGFSSIGIQTNGRRLAAPGYAEGLARAGLTDVHLSIHGAEAMTHDYHTGRQGSLAETLAGLAAARAAGLVAVVTTVLTRSNYRSLGGLPRLLSGGGAAAWLIAVTAAVGRAGRRFDRIFPRLGLAVPFAAHAMDAAHALGLRAWVRGVPACLLGPFAGRMLPDAPGAYGAACEGCTARTTCPGLDPAYLARFGDGELRTRHDPAPVAAATVSSDDLAALFVGTGPVAVRAPERDLAKKVTLPLLGKVKPAVAEVSAGAPRKTGQSLREILPDLFEKPGS